MKLSDILKQVSHTGLRGAGDRVVSGVAYDSRKVAADSLFVAIPAMFAHNFMVTRVRSITQQLDSFASELAANLELATVDSSIVEKHARVIAPTNTVIAHSAPAHQREIAVGASKN